MPYNYTFPPTFSIMSLRCMSQKLIHKYTDIKTKTNQYVLLDIKRI
jgi:hypothetical protein